MAQKTINNIGRLSERTVKLNTTEIVELIGDNKKVVTAILKLNNATISTESSVTSNCGCAAEKEIDRILPCNNKTVCINVTHEIDCIIKNLLQEIQFTFSGELTCGKIDLEIDYLPQQIMHQNNAYLDIDVKSAGSGKINLASGNIKFASAGLVYNGYQAGKQTVVIDDAKDGKQQFSTYCGKGWKLGIEQFLVKRKGSDGQDVYTYIDGDGNYHEFTEKFYYVDDSNNKTYINKSGVIVDLNGKLTYNEKEVKTERRSTSGLILETDYNGFKGSHLLEQRQDEQIELEENIEAYKNQFKQYVIIKKENGDTILTLKKPDKTLGDVEMFIANCTEDKLLLTESEAIQYNSLLLQQTSSTRVSVGKTVTSTSYSNTENYSDDKLISKKFSVGNYDSRLINMQRLVKDLRADLTTLTKKANYSGITTELNYQYDEYFKYLKSKALYYEEDDYNKCSVCTTGVGKKYYGTGSSNLVESDYTDDNSGLLSYHHLKDGYCDLQAEIERITDDLEKYSSEIEYESNYADSNKALLAVELRNEKKEKKLAEQRLRVFQKEFSNRVEKLQQNISKFEQEINDYMEVEQRKIVNSQIAMLVDRSDQNKTEIQKYYKQYVNKKHQLDQLYRQMPVSYITSDGNVMGFNKYGQFVATFDGYENQTAILYEENKIVAVKDTDNHETTFEYNTNGLLCKIVGADEKTISFEYDSNDLLTKLIAPNNETSIFTYCDDGKHRLHDDTTCSNYELKTITDNFGYGVEFVYDDECKIVKVNEFTDVFSVSNDRITKETAPVTQTVATIQYKSQTSASVTNKNGVTTTYIFDQLGKPVTVFEGIYDDPEDTTKSVSFEYADGKQSYAVEEDLTTENILKNIDPAGNTLNNATGIRQLKYVIPKEKFGNKTDFVFSAWAHADSAYVCDSRKTDFSFENVEQRNKSNLDANQQNRKYELKAVVNYDSGNPDVYAASFDWLNTDWQFLTLPVEIKVGDNVGDKLPAVFPFTVGNGDRKLVNVELCVDYSYNTGEILTDCLSLREGKWTYSTFDGNGRKLTDEDSQSKSITDYCYDENDRVVKQTVTDRQGRKFESNYEYNKQGSLVRSTNYAGVVEETVFDEKGREIKKIAYNLSDPTSKLYTESKRNEKGVITADVDESGKYDSVKYTYDHNGEDIVHTDGKGNKTAFGYKDGALVSISGNADGQESTNTMKYNADLLTKVSNGDTSYNYEYDGWSRTTKVKIAGKVYSQTEYVDNKQTKTVLANGDNLTATVDKHDRTTKQITSFANGITETIQIDYDNLPNIETVDIDISDGTKYNIVKTNENGKVISEARSGEYPLEKHYGYNADGDLESTEYTVGGRTFTYGYETDHTPDKRNSKVQLPFNVEQNFAYDGLGRTKEISLTDKLVKDIYYAKYGDHATNRINSVWYGINGIRKDNVKYTYDKAGNIATVTENGIVSARYVYDGLNRLVRENTADFGKITYEYDNAGNILCKTVRGKKYRYTYPQEGWKDQLLERSYKEYDGTEVVERFEYDVLGNPTIYRNKSLLWQGRRLKQFDDTTFTYDVNGIRTSKLNNGILTKYIYDGNNLVAELRNNEWIYYIYGVDGVAGFRYNGVTYLYRKNVQGDVTHIYKLEEDKSLTQAAHYCYDAWGNIQILHSINGIAELNPFRYRSYYFDEETGLYYLQTRYYDPELGRFISADSIEYLDPETIGGLNLYAYCGNNPVMEFDFEGTKEKHWRDTWWGKALGWLATATLVVFAVAMIAVVAVGSVASGGLLAAVLVGAGVGILAGVGGSIAVQAKTGNIDPWSVALSGAIGGVIGAISGAASWGLAHVGQAIGNSVGFALSEARHLSTGVKIAKVFGLTTPMLMKAGFIAGGAAGGFIGGKVANYMANEVVTAIFGESYTVDNPNYIRSSLLKLFKWLNALP